MSSAPRTNWRRGSSFARVKVAQAYRGTCAIVYDPAHVTRPSELPLEQWNRFCRDIPRYRTDPRWGRPIWTTSRGDMTHLLATIEECEELARVLREEIAAGLSG